MFGYRYFANDEIFFRQLIVSFVENINSLILDELYFNKILIWAEL